MNKPYQVSPNIVHRNQNGRVIMLEVEGTKLYELEDDVSVRVWELILEGKTVSEINDAIEAEFDTPPESSTFVREFIDSLIENNIIYA